MKVQAPALNSIVPPTHRGVEIAEMKVPVPTPVSSDCVTNANQTSWIAKTRSMKTKVDIVGDVCKGDHESIHWLHWHRCMIKMIEFREAMGLI